MRDLTKLDRYRLRNREISTFGKLGDSRRGVFGIRVDDKLFSVVATSDGGWDHVSVSRPSRNPTWDEMCAIKDLFFDGEDRVIQYHPPRSEYVNNHHHCLHLWRPNDGTEIPYPPASMVGWKS